MPKSPYKSKERICILKRLKKMKILKRRTIDISGSIYAPIPFWIAENYGIRRNSPVEYETEDDSVLVIKIGKTKHE